MERLDRGEAKPRGHRRRVGARVDNRAALARARAIIAFEFGDGLAEAKAAVDQLAGQGGLDAQIAAAYLALAQNDAKAAKHRRRRRARHGTRTTPAALYVAGQARCSTATPRPRSQQIKAAFDKDPRPLYGVALARAYAATSTWEDAIGRRSRARRQPRASGRVIARGDGARRSGPDRAGSAAGTDIRHAARSR